MNAFTGCGHGGTLGTGNEARGFEHVGGDLPDRRLQIVGCRRICDVRPIRDVTQPLLVCRDFGKPVRVGLLKRACRLNIQVEKHRQARPSQTVACNAGESCRRP